LKRPAGQASGFFPALYAFGSRSNIDDSETIKALQISKRRPRADAVLPPFVFLNLLERDAQGDAEVCLAYAERLSALAESWQSSM
jgi:hypothetical protein